jgi:hypothetical protein
MKNLKNLILALLCIAALPISAGEEKKPNALVSILKGTWFVMRHPRQAWGDFQRQRAEKQENERKERISQAARREIEKCQEWGVARKKQPWRDQILAQTPFPEPLVDLTLDYCGKPYPLFFEEKEYLAEHGPAHKGHSCVIS